MGGNPSLAMPASFGITMLLVVNAVMLTSAGSTLGSTFASTAKLTARDWSSENDVPTERQLTTGRKAVIVIVVQGNLPLFSLYLGSEVGSAVIAATTISGTMVMGLAPIFILTFLPGAGHWSFHSAFWPRIVFGIIMTLEGAMGLQIVPAWADIGVGKYAYDLGVNLWGVGISTIGFLIGCGIELIIPKKSLVTTPA